MSTREKLIADIEAFLRQHGMSASDFGLQAMGDRSFVTRLRTGRNVRISSMDKVQAWMAARCGAPRPRPRKRQTIEAAA